MGRGSSGRRRKGNGFCPQSNGLSCQSAPVKSRTLLDDKPSGEKGRKHPPPLAAQTSLGLPHSSFSLFFPLSTSNLLPALLRPTSEYTYPCARPPSPFLALHLFPAMR